MEIREKFQKIKTDFASKTIFAIVLSLVVNFAFIVYNAYLGFRFGDAFAIGISIYYFLLFWIMAASLLVEKYIFRKNEEKKLEIRKKNYKISSILIFIIDFCLIAPIILMAIKPSEVGFGLIPAISMAAYCVYKIIYAIISYRRSKKSQNPTAILLREVNIIGAIVSILTLQHTLIMVNGGMNAEMQALSLATSIAFIALIVLFSILSFIRNRKLFAQMQI